MVTTLFPVCIANRHSPEQPELCWRPPSPPWKSVPRLAIVLVHAEEGEMTRRRHTPKRVTNKVREAEVAIAAVSMVAEASRSIGVTEQTLYRWCSEYAGLRIGQARRLKHLESENGRLRRARGTLARQEWALAARQPSLRFRHPTPKPKIRPTTSQRRCQLSSTQAHQAGLELPNQGSCSCIPQEEQVAVGAASAGPICRFVAESRCGN